MSGEPTLWVDSRMTGAGHVQSHIDIPLTVVNNYQAGAGACLQDALAGLVSDTIRFFKAEEGWTGDGQGTVRLVFQQSVRYKR